MLALKILFVVAVFCGPIVYFIAIAMRKRARRDHTLAEPFPDAWVGILEKNLPFYRRLPANLQQELQQQTKLFLAEKSFEGGGGL